MNETTNILVRNMCPLRRIVVELSREYRVDTLSSMSSVILPSQPKESKGTALQWGQARHNGSKRSILKWLSSITTNPLQFVRGIQIQHVQRLVSHRQALPPRYKNASVAFH